MRSVFCWTRFVMPVTWSDWFPLMNGWMWVLLLSRSCDSSMKTVLWFSGSICILIHLITVWYKCPLGGANCSFINFKLNKELSVLLSYSVCRYFEREFKLVITLRSYLCQVDFSLSFNMFTNVWDAAYSFASSTGNTLSLM